MATINTQLIAIHDDIMEANETIVAFNEEQIATNTAMLEGVASAATATPQSNTTTISQNTTTTEQLLISSSKDIDMIEYLLETSFANLAIVKKNKAEINDRMLSILDNRKGIFQNKANIT